MIKTNHNVVFLLVKCFYVETATKRNLNDATKRNLNDSISNHMILTKLYVGNVDN